jgi:hypothetical protein
MEQLILFETGLTKITKVTNRKYIIVGIATLRVFPEGSYLPGSSITGDDLDDISAAGAAEDQLADQLVRMLVRALAVKSAAGQDKEEKGKGL